MHMGSAHGRAQCTWEEHMIEHNAHGQSTWWRTMHMAVADACAVVAGALMN